MIYFDWKKSGDHLTVPVAVVCHELLETFLLKLSFRLRLN